MDKNIGGGSKDGNILLIDSIEQGVGHTVLIKNLSDFLKTVKALIFFTAFLFFHQID